MGKTGKAYGFLNYDGPDKGLIKLIERNRIRANFPDNLKFSILHEEKSKLPQKVIEASKGELVYGAVPSSASSKQFGKLVNIKPLPAYELSHIVMAEAPDVTDSEFAEPLGQCRSNRVTAGMLDQIFIGISQERYQNDVFRGVVLYQDSRGRVQRY